MVNVVRMNGVVVYENKVTLKDKISEAIANAEKEMGTLNRETKRKKPMRKALALFGFVSTVALTAFEYVEAHSPEVANQSVDDKGFSDRLGEGIFNGMVNKMSDGIVETDGVKAEDTLLWKLNEYLSNTVLTTQDFFSNPSIVGIFTVIWYAVMSFSVIIIAKKGYDMVKAKILGSETMGVSELIIRLLGSVVLSFLSLKVAKLGVEFSNLSVDFLMKNLSIGNVSYESLGGSLSGFAHLCYMIAFIFLFGILGITYWMRQLNLIILGCLSPIANMSWVTDGGEMLKTLIKEMVTILLTPAVQGLILAIGSIMMLEVTTQFKGFWGYISALFLNLSILITMISTPTFLRKFVSGSANPLKFAFDAIVGLKTMPIRMAKLFK
jgi:hypothetical protein